LYNDFAEFKKIGDQKKVVFGSGIRPYYDQFKIDHKWDIKFLRGPLSAGALKNKFEYIADSAYALSLVKSDLPPVAKKYKVSVIPYFRSLSYFNWEKICNELGYHYISPLAEKGIEHTINEIAASEKIICEAMHGAIIADIMRVPWHRFVLSTPETEGERVGEFKWMDWLYSIDLKYTDASYIKFY
jgi:succinoglycan biosynthesis protein ExoV